MVSIYSLCGDLGFTSIINWLCLILLSRGIMPDGKTVAIKRLFFNSRQWVDHFFFLDS